VGFVNMIMEIRVHKIRGISCLAENRLALQVGLCYMYVDGWLAISTVTYLTFATFTSLTQDYFSLPPRRRWEL